LFVEKLTDKDIKNLMGQEIKEIKYGENRNEKWVFIVSENNYSSILYDNRIEPNDIPQFIKKRYKRFMYRKFGVEYLEYLVFGKDDELS